MISSSLVPSRALSLGRARSAGGMFRDALAGRPNCTDTRRHRSARVRVYTNPGLTRTPDIIRPRTPPRARQPVARLSYQEGAGGFQSPKVLGLNGLREGEPIARMRQRQET